MREIGVGLIGYGLGGRAFHAPYVGFAEGMTLRAIVSRDAAKVRRDLPDMRVVPSVEALLAERGIDLVIVSSPDALHADHALQALRAGKHVLVDKPFATTLAEAQAVADGAAARGLMLSVFHNRRWDADFLTLKRIVREGRLGEIVEVESRFDRWRPTPAAVWKEARAGGVWFDLGPHLVDQALCLFGEPEAVSADFATLREGAEAPDWFHVALRYPRLRVRLHASKLAADHGLRYAVHGTRGSWIKQGVDGQEAATVAGATPEGPEWGHDPNEGIYTAADGTSERLANEAGDYRLFWTALAAAVRGEGPNPVPATEALAVMRVLDAGLRSAERCREVPLTALC